MKEKTTLANMSSLTDQTALQVSLSVIGKLAITVTWQCIIVWANELYPTTTRCTLIAVNGVGTGLGGALAPVLINLVSIYSHHSAPPEFPVASHVPMYVGACRPITIWELFAMFEVI